MRRRHLLKSLGIAALAGCTTLPSNSGSDDYPNTTTETTQPTTRTTRPTTPSSGVTSLEVGETRTLGETIDLTVEDATLAEEVEFSSSPPLVGADDTMLLLVSLQAHNVGDHFSYAPKAHTFSVFAAGEQFRPALSEIQSVGLHLTEPVSGPFYTGAFELAPGKKLGGWLVFEVPRSMTEPVVVWKPDSWTNESPTTWQVSADTSVLSDVQLHSVDIPKTVESGTEAPISLTMVNHGNRAGTFRRRIEVVTEHGTVPYDETVKRRVPPGETVTFTKNVSTKTLSDLTVSVSSLEDRSITVTPATRQYGTVFETLNGFEVKVSLAALTGSITWKNGTTRSAKDGHQLAIHRLSSINLTDTQAAPPDSNDFDAIADGVRSDTTYSWRERVIAEPDLGPMYDPRAAFNLHSGDELSGVVIHEIPAEATPESVSLQGNFRIDHWREQECRWSKSPE